MAIPEMRAPVWELLRAPPRVTAEAIVGQQVMALQATVQAMQRATAQGVTAQTMALATSAIRQAIIRAMPEQAAAALEQALQPEQRQGMSAIEQALQPEQQQAIRQAMSALLTVQEYAALLQRVGRLLQPEIAQEINHALRLAVLLATQLIMQHLEPEQFPTIEQVLQQQATQRLIQQLLLGPRILANHRLAFQNLIQVSRAIFASEQNRFGGNGQSTVASSPVTDGVSRRAELIFSPEGAQMMLRTTTNGFNTRETSWHRWERPLQDIETEFETDDTINEDRIWYTRFTMS